MRLVSSIILPLAVMMTTAPAASAAEEPAHQVVEKAGKFEIRAYGPMILASVEVDSSRRDAANSGFRPLADYIFGANRGRAEIEMTTPVLQTPATQSSQTIAMTAPVLQAPADDGRWIVSFVMPGKWTMETLPDPVNQDVRLTQLPGETLAAVRFSGLARPAAQLERQAELETWIAARGWRITGPARVAFYDPPWTPGPLRRNEILIPVARGSAD